jgi:GntR family phosphonate transport system transcriptional regulator
MIRVEQGRGSFVAEEVMDYAVVSRMRFSEWVRRQNKEPSGRVLRLEQIAATEGVASALALVPGDPVVCLRRLGLADGRPVGLTAHHFPSARLPGLFQALGETQTVTEALARAGVAYYRRQVTRVTARMPTPQEADLLCTLRVRPLLVTESINVDPEGVPVEFGVSCYPTPRVQIVFEP